MLSILYNSFLALLLLLLSPKMLWQKKYRQRLKSMLHLKLPLLPKRRGPTLWVHAVSFGETRAVAPLVRRLKEEWPDSVILVSTMTESGQEEARRTIREADLVLFLPLDFSFIVRRVLKWARPKQVILVETDFWYHFLKESRRQGARIALVNGKISAASARRFASLRWLSKKMFSAIDLFLVQSTVYQERFLQLGILPEKVVATGNIKLDSSPEAMEAEDLQRLRRELFLQEEDIVLTIGSTHAPEEQELMDAIGPLFKEYPHLKVLLVPRHPQRLIKERNILLGYPYQKLSELRPESSKENILFIDQLGILKRCYQIADIAIVAGSFGSQVGGHNIIEPCYYGVPVLFGPSMHGQPDLKRLIEEYQAGQSVSLVELPTVLKEWLDSQALRKGIGQRGLALVQESAGATEKVVRALKGL
ncbi:MAG: gseA [Chlamydiales bacterium]|jgi:3-deoxy-D-manno-octulosonic-acid transferase|nr:gseA [Chlamydiales bacterium]